MWRFVFVLLFCVAAAPLGMQYLDGKLAAGNQPRIEASTSGSEAANTDAGRREVIAAASNGQFLADTRLNGRNVTMLVDTGASATVLPESIAKSIGIFLKSSDYKHPVRTANGVTYGASAIIDVMKIGAIRLRSIETIVLEDRSLGVPLLGMSALSRLKRFDMSDGNLVLIQ